MNTLAYFLYILFTWLITVHVGLRFYRNGFPFIVRLLQGDEKLSRMINRLLLVGYYLLNLGYVLLMLRGWETIHSLKQMLATVLVMTGRIMLVLSFIHYINMAMLAWLGSRIKKIHHVKK